MNCIHNSSGGSLRELLSRNVGQYAAASFLVGSCRLVRPGGRSGGGGDGLSGAAAGERPHRVRPVCTEIYRINGQRWNMTPLRPASVCGMLGAVR